MAESIVMPKVSMGQTEGQVSEWLVPVGDWVEKNQTVMAIETEKVTYECEAPASGYLVPVVEIGQVVPCGETVALLAQSEEELERLRKERAPAGAVATADSSAETRDPQPAATSSVASPPQPMPSEATGDGTHGGRRIKISPVAKKKAKAHHLDIRQLKGSGPGGRILNRDVEEAIAARATTAPQAAPAWSGEVFDGIRVKASLPLRGMRKAIAEHMMRSLEATAQTSFAGEVDMSALIQLRDKLLGKEQEIGTRITFNDLFVYILCKAVQHVPQVNASLVGDEIKIWEDINVGIAVAVELGPYESGLVVPVLRNADQKSLSEISLRCRELSQRARENALTPEELSGGTITVSNVGAFAPGWTVSTPVLNLPQAVVVQPGAIVKKPVVVDDQVTIRPMMTISITFDHRVLDGVPILKFYTRMKEFIENPEYLHL